MCVPLWKRLFKENVKKHAAPIKSATTVAQEASVCFLNIRLGTMKSIYAVERGRWYYYQAIMSTASIKAIEICDWYYKTRKSRFAS